MRSKHLKKSDLPAPRRVEILSDESLAAYLRRVASIPRLTREEEHWLAVKYFTEKDIEAARKLILSNLWLVVKIAKDHEKNVKNLLDLIQEGTLGLFEALKNFDPFKGVRFPTYAAFWVKAFVIKYILSNYRLVKIGKSQKERWLFFNLKKQEAKLKSIAGTETIDNRELAELLEVSPEKVDEMRDRLKTPELSLQSEIFEGKSLEQTLVDESVNVEEEVYSKEFVEQANKALEAFYNSLSRRDQIIFEERVLKESKATLQELSNQLGISLERVRQLENQIKQNLKKFLLFRLGEELGLEQQFD
jgi:RNA polymerase sigma-32 factor